MVTFALLFFSDLPEIPGKVASVGWISGDTQNYGPGTHFPSLIRMGGAAHWACTDGPTGGRMVRDSPRPHGDFHKGTTTMGCQKAIPTKLLFFVLICSATIAFPQTRQSFFNFFFRLRLGVFFLGRRQRPLASARSGRGGGKGGGKDFDANVRRVFF